jgi:squalene synthase HpnC
VNFELRAADAHCRFLASRHPENFIVASRLLPASLRPDMVRVYAYCRTTDDLGDESGPAASTRLLRWRSEVADLFAGGAPVHPVLVALGRTVAGGRLAAGPFLDLIAANLRDQHTRAYGTWPELHSYCMLSAASVGRIVLRLFGVHDPEAERLSDDVCVGLQLANFAQDVRRDAERGRRYLLVPEMAELGLAGAVRAHCERARGLLASGAALERMVSGRLRLQLSLYRLGGLAVVRAIEGAGWHTARARPRVSAAARTGLLVRAALGLGGGGGARPRAV